MRSSDHKSFSERPISRRGFFGLAIGAALTTSALNINGCKSRDAKHNTPISEESGITQAQINHSAMAVVETPVERIIPATEAIEETEEIRALDALIAEIEVDMTEFEKLLRPMIEKNIKDESLKSKLLAPFDLFLRNTRENKQKNQRRICATAPNCRFNRADNELFSYDFLDARADDFPDFQGKARAAFEPFTRSILLPRDLSYSNKIYNLLTIYHELVHAIIDYEIFKKYGAIKHHDIVGSVKGLRLEEEAEAYALEIEVANLYLAGFIKAWAQSTKNPEIPQTNLIKPTKEEQNRINQFMYNLSEEEKNALRSILFKFAQNYYPEGLNGNNFPPGYLDTIFQYMEEEGFNPQMQGEDGYFKPIIN